MRCSREHCVLLLMSWQESDSKSVSNPHNGQDYLKSKRTVLWLWTSHSLVACQKGWQNLMKWKVWKIVRKISDEKLVKMLQFCIFLVVDKWQLWFHGKIVEKNWLKKVVKMVGFLQFSAFDHFDFTRKRVDNWQNVMKWQTKFLAKTYAVVPEKGESLCNNVWESIIRWIRPKFLVGWGVSQ